MKLRYFKLKILVEYHKEVKSKKIKIKSSKNCNKKINFNRNRHLVNRKKYF